MSASYHNHTRWSDGRATVAEMLQAAQRAGLEEVGISDHFVLSPYPEVDISWAMPDDSLAEYVDDILAAAAGVDIPVRLGVEIDFFPETFAESLQRVATFPFDYLIGGVHFADSFPLDCHGRFWKALDAAGIERVHRTYWQRARELAEAGGVDWIAHLDLPKKFGFLPEVQLDHEIAATLEAVAAAGIALEINTAGWDKPCRDCYPTPPLLAACRKRDIPMLISADAHAPGEIARYFTRAEALLRNVGYEETVRFARRRRTAAPLPCPADR